jgi:hypothetical protein
VRPQFISTHLPQTGVVPFMQPLIPRRLLLQASGVLSLVCRKTGDHLRGESSRTGPSVTFPCTTSSLPSQSESDPTSSTTENYSPQSPQPKELLSAKSLPPHSVPIPYPRPFWRSTPEVKPTRVVRNDRVISKKIRSSAC